MCAPQHDPPPSVAEPVPTPAEPEPPPADPVEEAAMESFPASDPPAWTGALAARGRSGDPPVER